jgi:hypothetical protein
MRGGSQAALIDTEDGRFVVKLCQNPQHRRILINEAVSSELLKRLSIAAPSWACVHVDQNFLNQFPELRISRQYGFSAVEPGWHYGSRHPVDPARKAVYDFIPAVMLEKVSNRDDFLKVFVFDIWVDNRDRTQAVFFRSARRGLCAEMIDHGHAFGFDGVEWNFSNAPLHRHYPGVRELYDSSKAAEHHDRLIVAIQMLSRDDLTQILQQVPVEWIENDGAFLSRQFDRLMDRAVGLHDLVADALAHAKKIEQNLA